NVMNGTHGMGCLALRRTKTAEIVFPNQMGGRLAHKGKIKRPEYPSRAPCHEWRTHRIISEHIDVRATDGSVAGVKRIRYWLGPAYSDAGWQQSVYAT